MLTGVYKPTAGRIVFDGQDVTGKPPHAITERGIGRTFQNIRLFQKMTALENVLVGMHCRLSRAESCASVLRTPRGEARGGETHAKRARELLEFSGLRRRRDDEFARNLSYGDQRRLEVARALATRAEAAAPRRADGGHEPAGDGGVHRPSSSKLRTSRS